MAVLHHPAPPRLRVRDLLAEALLYLALACAVLWPLPAHLRSKVALGTEDVATVPFAMVWSFWWQADRIANGLADFWQAPIFSPTTDTFALSETNTLGGFLMAPLVLATDSPSLGHNLFLLLALALNGLVASRLLQAWGVSRGVALVSGVAMLMLPLPLQEIGVLPLVPVFGILCTLLTLTRWVERPGLGRAVWLGVALAATYLLCFQYALFLALLLLGVGWILLPRAAWRPRALASLVVAAAIAGAGVAPVVVAQLGSVTEEAGFKRKTSKVSRLAAKPRHYARTPWRQAVPVPGVPVAKNAGWKAFFPGAARVLLAVLGLAATLALPRTTRIGWFLGAGALLAYAMSLGPNLALGGLNVWEWMSEHVPGYGKVRSVSRWAVFVQVFVVLLGGFGLQGVLDRVIGRAPEGPDGGLSPARGRRRVGWSIGFLVLAGLCMFEMTPARTSLVDVPDTSVHQGWGTWVRENTPPDAVLAFLPFSEGGNVKDYEIDAERMLLGGVHGRAMVNGYSSYFPRPFRDLKKRLAEFPTEDGVAALREVGVTFVVVPEETYPEHRVSDYPAFADGLRLEFRDERAGWTVYSVRASR